MQDDDKYIKKTSRIEPIEDADEGDAGQGDHGGSGIAFHEFMSSEENIRADQLPPEKLREVLAAHAIANKENIIKQKDSLAKLESVRKGEKTKTYQQGMGAGVQSNYKSHPKLQGAQFAGIDKQVNNSPIENDAKTNDEKRNELQYQHQQRYNPSNAPRTAPPKPSIYNR